MGWKKKLGIAAGGVVAAFFVLNVVGSVILFSDVSDDRAVTSPSSKGDLDSETKRVKNLVRESPYISEPSKEVILRAIDTNCQQGYMHGKSIGDGVLAGCLKTYEEQATTAPPPPPPPIFQYTTDKDVYTFGEDVKITGRYLGMGERVTWTHPNGSIITPAHQQVTLGFGAPSGSSDGSSGGLECHKYKDPDGERKSWTSNQQFPAVIKGWDCMFSSSDESFRDNSLANNNWLSTVRHTFTVSTSEYWTGEVTVRGSFIADSGIPQFRPIENESGHELILRFEIVPVR